MNNRHPHQRRRTRRQGGATLIELMVVLVIFALLAASAVPMLAPLMSNRQTREAARIVSAALTGARNRAMQSGRPYALVLDRLVGLPEACVSLAYAEVPPPYAGDSFSSQVLITYSGTTPYINGLTPDSVTSPTYSQDVGWMGTVRVGDLIRFNNQGSYFQIGRPQNANAINTSGFLILDPATGVNQMWPLSTLQGAPAVFPAAGVYRYQIQRAPMRSAAGGVTLPGSAVIDLNFSGFDQVYWEVGVNNPISRPYGFTYSFQPLWPPAGVASPNGSNNPFVSNSQTADTSSVVIMFAPSGAIDTVWCWSNDVYTTTGVSASNPYPIPYPIKPLTPIHLLIGRREMVPLPTAPQKIISPVNSSAPYDPSDPNFKPYLNWQDLGCLWVSVDHKSGAISTAENAASTTAIQNNGYGYGLGGTHGYGSYTEIMESRQLALELQRLGGR